MIMVYWLLQVIRQIQLKSCANHNVLSFSASTLDVPAEAVPNNTIIPQPSRRPHRSGQTSTPNGPRNGPSVKYSEVLMGVARGVRGCCKQGRWGLLTTA